MPPSRTIVLASAVVLGCGLSAWWRPSPSSTSAIYRVVLDSLYLTRSYRGAPVSRVVVAARTRSWPAPPQYVICYHTPVCVVPKDLFEAYRLANGSDTAIEPFAGLALPLHLVDSAEARRLFTGPNDAMHDPWPRFWDAFPGSGGLATFSQIGVDRTASWALVHYDVSCGMRAGCLTCACSRRALAAQWLGGW
jgi:hypothetical protein